MEPARTNAPQRDFVPASLRNNTELLAELRQLALDYHRAYWEAVQTGAPPLPPPGDEEVGEILEACQQVLSARASGCDPGRPPTG